MRILGKRNWNHIKHKNLCFALGYKTTSSCKKYPRLELSFLLLLLSPFHLMQVKKRHFWFCASITKNTHSRRNVSMEWVFLFIHGGWPWLGVWLGRGQIWLRNPSRPMWSRQMGRNPPPFCLTHGAIHVHFVGFGRVAVLQGVLHDQGMLCHPGWVAAHKKYCDVLAFDQFMRRMFASTPPARHFASFTTPMLCCARMAKKRPGRCCAFVSCPHVD